MKEDIGRGEERDFETWLGGEAHVFVKDRTAKRWSPFRMMKFLAKNAALIGLAAGIIIGAAAAAAFFRGTSGQSSRGREEKSPSGCEGKERNGT
ncbi:hypothetical protein [Petrachloros mirabilis]